MEEARWGHGNGSDRHGRACQDWGLGRMTGGVSQGAQPAMRCESSAQCEVSAKLTVGTETGGCAGLM